jgi:hypothetical protein
MFAFLATLCAGLFAGAAGYISLVEHRARLQAGPAVALAQFRPGFSRARAIQASLALAGGTCALVTAWRDGGLAWFVVALLLLGVVVFTLVWIAPVYEALLDPALTAQSPEAPALLARWGRRHHVRSALGLLAFLLALGSR